jgi:probable F420-dependent oxidoreductase
MARGTRAGLGRVGVWSRELRFHPDRDAARDAAAELEQLGYGALWIPDVGGDVLGAIGEMLVATSSIAVATGILNIWMHDAADVAAGVEAFAAGDRLLIGLGASHAAVVDADAPGRYAKPLTAMREYLDELDAAVPPLPADGRILAALGPKMLDLARERTGGAHPYLVPVAHTAQARERLGPERLLAPELGVAYSPDLVAARDVARAHVADYLALPNYANSFRRSGFTEEDLAGGGSDRLVDALVAYGDEERIAARVAEHLEAGADHVCVQVVGQRDEGLAREAWRRLAPALVGL